MGMSEVKKYILPVREVDRGIYNLMRDGKKKVETRAAGPKYAHIKDGDLVVLKCGKDRFERTVKKVRTFKTVDALLKTYAPKDIHPSAKTVDDLKKMYRSFPGYTERLAQYGILAFEFTN
jgi:ASC-1-like (ASCH) protein